MDNAAQKTSFYVPEKRNTLNASSINVFNAYGHAVHDDLQFILKKCDSSRLTRQSDTCISVKLVAISTRPARWRASRHKAIKIKKSTLLIVHVWADRVAGWRGPSHKDTTSTSDSDKMMKQTAKA